MNKTAYEIGRLNGLVSVGLLSEAGFLKEAGITDAATAQKIASGRKKMLEFFLQKKDPYLNPRRYFKPARGKVPNPGAGKVPGQPPAVNRSRWGTHYDTPIEPGGLAFETGEGF